MHKYGREFSVAVMENRDGCVSERVSISYLFDCPCAALIMCVGTGNEENHHGNAFSSLSRRLSRRDRQGVQH